MTLLKLLENTQHGIKMEKKFRKGDFVWNDIQDRLATIVAYHEKNDSYELDNGFMADEDDLEPLDKEYVKNKFLNELQCLLDKYNAEVFAYQSDFEEVTLAFYIGDDAIEYGSGEDTSEVKVTPSNIFDYDK